MAFLDDMATVLEAAGVGTIKTTVNNPAWPIYVGMEMPGTQTPAIMVVQSPASPAPIDVMGQAVGAPIFRIRSFHVTVRNESPETASAKGEAVFAALHGYKAGAYTQVKAMGAVTLLAQRDELQMARVVCDYEAWSTS